MTSPTERGSNCNRRRRSNGVESREGRKGQRRPYLLLTIVLNLTTLVPHATTAVAASQDGLQVSKSKSKVSNISRELVNITAYVTDPETCYKDLLQADVSNDGEMTSDEYFNFILSQSDNNFVNATSFKELPLAIVQLFNFQACDCESTTCCADDATGNTTSPPSINLSTMANTTRFCSDITVTLAAITATPSPTTPSPTNQTIPTAAPTNQTISPTAAPTNQTLSPTTAPTNQTLKPAVAPTNKPTTSSPSPTDSNGLLNVPVAFTGCNVNNYTQQDIMSGQRNTLIMTIETALQNLSKEVLNEFRRQRRRRMGTYKILGTMTEHHRQLVLAFNNVTVVYVGIAECIDAITSSVITLAGSSCPSCLQLQSIVTLNLDDAEADVIKPLFEDKLYKAIQSYGLGYPGFQITPITNAPTPTGNGAGIPSDKLSTAAVIGIACAAFAAGILTIAGLYTNQRRQERRRKAFGPTPPDGTSPAEVLTGSEVDQDKRLMGIPAATTATAAVDVTVAAEEAIETKEAAEDVTQNSGSDGDLVSLAESDVSSSQAGSSGWSSSAGLSSLNTGSFDSGDLESGTLSNATSPTHVHKNLSALLAAGGAVTRLDDRHRSGPIQFASLADSTVSVYKSEPGEVVMEEEGFTRAALRQASTLSFESTEMRLPTQAYLDAAIKAGDWATVGATATLMAGGSIGDSSNSNSTGDDDGTATTGVASENAKELDRLVDTADWEGVVLAASKFERPDIGSPGSFEESVRPRQSATLFPSNARPVGFDSPGQSTMGSDSLEPSQTEGSGSLYSSEVSHQGSSSENVKGSSADSEYDGSDSGSASHEVASSVGLSSVLSPATSSTNAISETKRAEIRAEVEALVRRVVPDEINNVDEMMNQFKGREEELIETLRTMQERNIAKRERAARNKSAKLEAKREVRQKRKMQAAKATGGQSSREGLPPRSVGVAAGAGAAIAVTTLREETPMARLRNRTPSPADLSSTTEFSEPTFKMEPQERIPAQKKDTPDEDEGSSSNGSPVVILSGDEVKEQVQSTSDTTGVTKIDVVRESLEKAIAAGNWEAVGEAAALMSDYPSSASAGSSIDLRNVSRLSENDSSGYASASTGAASVDPIRAAKLDGLIETGDWSGVVLAAKQLSKANITATPEPRQEKEEKPKSWRVRRIFGGGKSRSSKAAYADTDSEGNDVTKSVVEKGLQEEQDALAQAEIWMAIAAQSKQDGAKEAKGASEAADWAIERSLSALQIADRSAADSGDDKALVLPGAVKDDTSV